MPCRRGNERSTAETGSCSTSSPVCRLDSFIGFPVGHTLIVAPRKRPCFAHICSCVFLLFNFAPSFFLSSVNVSTDKQVLHQADQGLLHRPSLVVRVRSPSLQAPGLPSVFGLGLSCLIHFTFLCFGFFFSCFIQELCECCTPSRGTPAAPTCCPQGIAPVSCASRRAEAATVRRTSRRR